MSRDVLVSVKMEDRSTNHWILLIFLISVTSAHASESFTVLGQCHMFSTTPSSYDLEDSSGLSTILCADNVLSGTGVRGEEGGTRPAGHIYAAGDHQFPPDAGSGSDDEDFSNLFGDVNSGDVTFRCYKCIGVTEQSGCNVTLLRQHPEDYWTDCNGHCINVTTGHHTIFDCTEKVSARKAQCFQRKATKMCVCGNDLCNGPSQTRNDVMDLPASRHGIQLLSEHEVDVILSEILRQRQNNDSFIMRAAKSRGHCMMFGGHAGLFLTTLWCYILWKNFSV